MTPFAIVFMSISMLSVTALAGFCLSRILRDDRPSAEDGEDI